MAIGVGIALVLAIAVCGVIGVGSFLLLGNGETGSSAEPAPATVPSEEPARAFPTDLPTDLPTALPTFFLTAPPTDGPPRAVVLEAGGGGGTAQVMYPGTSGFLDLQSEQVDLPWRKELTVPGQLSVLMTVISLTGDRVTCRVTLDGREVTSASGEGIVTCVGAFDR
jgi:hypothetical protein